MRGSPGGGDAAVRVLRRCLCLAPGNPGGDQSTKQQPLEPSPRTPSIQTTLHSILRNCASDANRYRFRSHLLVSSQLSVAPSLCDTGWIGPALYRRIPHSSHSIPPYTPNTAIRLPLSSGKISAATVDTTLCCSRVPGWTHSTTAHHWCQSTS